MIVSRRNTLRALTIAAFGCSSATPPGADVDARIVRADVVDASDTPVDTAPACLMPETPSVADGPCRCNSDCEEGVLCEPESFMGKPRGRCLRTCSTAADCGGGYRCFGTAVMQCNLLCNTNDDCGPARYCFGGACRNVCQRDDDCFSGYCNRWSARCEAPGTSPGEGALTGEVCLRDEDCRSNICLSGACASPCSLTAQGCPDGETCIGSGRNDLGLCYQVCTATTECRRQGARCTTVTGRGIRACQ
ncbi:MAG: hypothetical protein U0326_17470 [Polyangiales bacterium]